MSDRRQNLIAYGVNYAEVMERFVDDEDLDFDCLMMFIDDPAFEGLRKSVADQDYVSAFDYAHSLKGVAGNLGLTPLYNIISQIVEPLRNRDYSDLPAQWKAVQTAREELKILLGAMPEEQK